MIKESTNLAFVTMCLLVLIHKNNRAEKFDGPNIQFVLECLPVGMILTPSVKGCWISDNIAWYQLIKEITLILGD